jgi:hypothetical protein
LHDLPELGVFEQVAGGARPNGVQHALVLAGDGQHEHLGAWGRLEHQRRRVDARHARHVQVHHDHVRPERREPSERGLGAVRVGDVEAFLLEQGAEARAEHLMIVHHQDAEATLPNLSIHGSVFFRLVLPRWRH